MEILLLRTGEDAACPVKLVVLVGQQPAVQHDDVPHAHPDQLATHVLRHTAA